MSNYTNNGYYRNRFKDGPNDPPPKKKKIRTNHSTWGDILRDLGGNRRKKAINKTVEKAQKGY